MDFNKFKMFRAEGEGLIGVKRWQEASKDHRLAAYSLMGTIPGAAHPVWTRLLSGFLFNAGEVPGGWKRDKFLITGDKRLHQLCEGWNSRTGSLPSFVPDRRKQAGRDMWTKMRAIYAPGCLPFGPFVGMTDHVVTGDGNNKGQILRSPGFVEIGGVYLIASPIQYDKSYESPPDSQEIKASEYWAMVEAAEELKTSPAAQP